MTLQELLERAWQQLKESFRLIFLSGTPIVLLVLLISSISKKYLEPIMQFYDNLDNSNKLDLDLLAEIIELKKLLAGPYTSFILYGILIMLIFLLIHTMNIYGVLTLNASSQKAPLKQLLQASFFYFPKVLFATIIKWGMIGVLVFFLQKLGLPLILITGTVALLWFILRLSTTYQIVDTPILVSYFLSIKSVFGNPVLNLKLASWFLLEILAIMALYGLSIQILVWGSVGISLFSALLVTLALIPCYLLWNFSNTIAFVFHYSK